jgi:hypothetical protein
MAFAIALSLSKPGSRSCLYAACSDADVRAGHDTPCGVLQVLPAPPVAVSPARYFSVNSSNFLRDAHSQEPPLDASLC